MAVELVCSETVTLKIELTVTGFSLTMYTLSGREPALSLNWYSDSSNPIMISVMEEHIQVMSDCAQSFAKTPEKQSFV